MKILFIGDTMAEPGVRAVEKFLPTLRVECAADLVICNAENIADGAGVTRKNAQRLLAAGVDVMTNGNHIWDKREAFDYIKAEARLIRPHNFPDGTPGTGWTVAVTASGVKVGILNLLGNIFMSPNLSCPFRCAEAALKNKPADVKIVFVDFHAETTSEKTAMSWFLDGQVSAVVGTHTHIPTADERILPQGTAYLTDVGMTGCYDSVIGLDIKAALQRFVEKIPARFDVVEGPATLHAALVDIDESTGRARSIQRVSRRETDC